MLPLSEGQAATTICGRRNCPDQTAVDCGAGGVCGVESSPISGLMGRLLQAQALTSRRLSGQRAPITTIRMSERVLRVGRGLAPLRGGPVTIIPFLGQRRKANAAVFVISEGLNCHYGLQSRKTGTLY